MGTYLERYLNGAYEQVWDELVALGADVRQEPVLSDAKAVATETMRRVRVNVEKITERLKALPFDFENPNEAFEPPDPETIAQLDAFEREIGPVPLSVRAWAEHVGSVQWMGTYPGLSFYHHSAVSPTVDKAIRTGTVDASDVRSILGNMQLPPGTPTLNDASLQKITDQLNQMLGGFQNMFKNMPDSPIKQNMTNYLQQAPAEPRKPLYTISGDEIVISDPLVIHMGEISPDFYDEWEVDEEEKATGKVEITVAPDVHHKSNYSGGGGYSFELPNPAADAVLIDEAHNTMFVKYLRIVFEWGGFPGAREYAHRNEAVIAQLKVDLLPF